MNEPNEMIYEIKQLKEKLSMAGREGLGLVTKVEDYKQQISELNCAQLRKQQEMAETIHNHRKEISYLTARHENAINEIQNDFNEQLKIMKEKMAQCVYCNPKLRKQTFEKEKNAKEEIKYKLKTLEDENKKLRNDLDRMKETSSSISNDPISGEKTIREMIDLEQKNCELVETIKSLKKELKNSEVSMDQSKKDAETIDDLKQQISVLKSQNENQENLNKKLENRASETQKKLDDLNQQFEILLENSKKTATSLMECVNKNMELSKRNRGLLGLFKSMQDEN